MVILKRNVLLEEILNSITHGIGALFSLFGIVLFFFLQINTTPFIKIIGFSIFSASMLCMFIFSTLSHSLVYTKASRVFTIFDHSSIFLLIAGTYTPVLLSGIKGTTGISMLFVVWILTVVGIVLKAIFLEKMEFISVLLYLGLGWVALLIIRPLLVSIKHNILFLFLIGGIFYSLGTIFYATKRIPFSHTIWHIFVMAGSACHFIAVFLL